MRRAKIPLPSHFVPVAAFFGAGVQVLSAQSALRQTNPAGLEHVDSINGFARAEQDMTFGIDSELRHGLERLDNLVAEMCGRAQVLKCYGATVTAIGDVKRLAKLGELTQQA